MTPAAEIRAFLHAHIDRTFPDGSVVVDEYGMGGRWEFATASIADVAVFAPSGLHLFEIKGDADSCRRLAGQVRCYSRFGQTATLIAGARLYDKAIEAIPAWWGAFRMVDGAAGGGLTRLVLARVTNQNPDLEPACIAAALWSDEALSELRERGRAKGMGRLCAKVRRAELVKLLSPDELREVVHRHVARRTWFARKTAKVRTVRRRAA